MAMPEYNVAIVRTKCKNNIFFPIPNKLFARKIIITEKKRIYDKIKPFQVVLTILFIYL